MPHGSLRRICRCGLLHLQTREYVPSTTGYLIKLWYFQPMPPLLLCRFPSWCILRQRYSAIYIDIALLHCHHISFITAFMTITKFFMRLDILNLFIRPGFARCDCIRRQGGIRDFGLLITWTEGFLGTQVKEYSGNSSHTNYCNCQYLKIDNDGKIARCVVSNSENITWWPCHIDSTHKGSTKLWYFI